VVEQFGRLFDTPFELIGTEASDALLSDGRVGYDLLGTPQTPPETMICWIADWLLRRQPTLGKPSHFQTRDGKF